MGVKPRTTSEVFDRLVDEELLVNRIEAIRAQNNTHWMDIVRLSLELAPERTKEILRQIQQKDGEIRRLTQELAGS